LKAQEAVKNLAATMEAEAAAKKAEEARNKKVAEENEALDALI
jgi:hypothetical protein